MEKDRLPITPPLRNKLLAGSAWMVGLRWTMRLLGAINIVILARLLTPADFGLVAMATAIVGLSKVFFELGVDYALIRNVDATREHFDTAWTIKILQSIALSITILIASRFAGDYYNDVRVVSILDVLALSVIVQGLSNIGVVSFRKDLNFNKEFKFLFWSKLISVSGTIALAFIFQSYWALVFGILLAAVIECLFSYFYHPFRPRCSFIAFNDIWTFSKWMIVLQVCNYFTLKFDRILLGGLTTPSVLGNYTIGTELANMATAELVTPVSRAIVPGLAKLQTDPKRLRGAFLKTLGATALVTFPASIGMLLVATEIVPIALGPDWSGAVVIVQVASIFCLFGTLGSAASNLSAVTGHISKLAALAAFRALLFLSSFVFVFEYGGAVAVLSTKVLIAGFSSAVVLGIVSKTHSISANSMVAQLYRPTVASMAMATAVLMVPTFAMPNVLLLLIAKIAVGGFFYIGSVLILWQLSSRNDCIEDDIVNMLQQRFR